MTQAVGAAPGEAQHTQRGIPVAALMLLASLLFAVLRQGAYHQWQHQVFSVLMLVVGALLIVTRAGRSSIATAALVVAPLFVSTVISTLASADRSDARSTFLLIGLIAIALAVGRSVAPDNRGLAIDAVLLVASVVALTAIWGVATHSAPWGRITEGVWRGSSSLTYANAAAAVAGPCAVLSFCRAAQTGHRIYAVATTLLLIGFVSTQSRGGALALLAIAVGASVFVGIGQVARSAPGIVAGTAMGAIPLVTLAADSKDQQPIIVVVALTSGLAITYLAMAYQDHTPPPVVSLGLGVAIVFGVVLLTDLASPLTERLTLRSGTTAGGQEAAVVFGDRAKEWSTAWDLVGEAPLLGHGPGVVDLRWVEDGRTFQALFVHNEYLELAVTHGALGLVALVASGALVVAKRSRTVSNWPIVLAVGGYLLHSGVDFLWHLPALPVLFAFLAGLTLEPDSIR